MRLAYTDWHMIVNWPENRVPVVVVEPNAFYRKIITDLCAQSDGSDGDFVLSENWQPVSIEKNVCVVTDPFSIILNDRSSQVALTKWLCKQTTNEHNFEATQEIKQQINTWALKIIDDSEEPLELSGDVDVSQLLKACCIKFAEENASMPELLYRRMCITQSFLKRNCFIFVGLKQYLTQAELEEIYKVAQYRKIRIMLLENRQPEMNKAKETLWLIDKDYCEVYSEEV